MKLREQLIHDHNLRRVGNVIYLKPDKVRVPWAVLLLAMIAGAAIGVGVMLALVN